MENSQPIEINPTVKIAAHEKNELLDESSNMQDFKHIYLRDLNTVQSKDLADLTEVVEGWFLEYKERMTEPAKLAKSLSSFANSHGGLLIIGIRENQKTRKLDSFVPMGIAAAENCVTQVRNAAIAHLVPAPFFETKIIEVPSLTLDYEQRWIVLVKVPRGFDGPYLHSSGCIYSRVGDSAAPIQLHDIGLIERLWSQRKEQKEKLRSRIDFLSSQTKKRNPCVTIVVSALSSDPTYQHISSFEKFQQCARKSINSNSTPLFDNIYPLDTSYIARRTESNIKGNGFFWDYDYQRRLHFIQIPIATHRWTGKSFEEIPQNSSWNLAEVGNYFYGEHRGTELFVLNLLPTLYFMSIILHKLEQFHGSEKQMPKMKLNIRALNVMQTVGYLGTPAYLEYIRKWGLPFIYRDVDFVFPLDDSESWYHLKFESGTQTNESLLGQDYRNSFPIFMLLARSLGISLSVSALARENSAEDFDLTELIKIFSDVSSSSFSFSSQDNPEAV